MPFGSVYGGAVHIDIRTGLEVVAPVQAQAQAGVGEVEGQGVAQQNTLVVAVVVVACGAP